MHEIILWCLECDVQSLGYQHDEKNSFLETTSRVPMCQLLRAGPGVRVTRLLVTFLGSQLDKPRLFLVATNRVHVNIVVIINAIVLYILVFMYLLEIKLLLLHEHYCFSGCPRQIIGKWYSLKKMINTYVLLQRYDIMYVTLSCFV